MKSQIILMLGGNKLNLGILNKFKSKGYSVFVIDWNEHPDLTGDIHYQIDVKDYDAIINALKRDGYWQNIVFAYSSIDLAVKSVAIINKSIGLLTIYDIGLECSSSKSKMTKRWSEEGLLNRKTLTCSVFQEEIVHLNSQYKLIVKPDNSASSRGITIIEKGSGRNIVEYAFSRAREEATNNLVVVEEYVEGTEYTVEMIGDSYGNVSIYGISRKSHTENTKNNKIAVKLHYNIESELLQTRIADYAIKCYKALGFSCSFGHLEILVKEDGILSPVEIGARSSGFIASDLVDVVSGVDYLESLMQVQRGEKINKGLHEQTDYSSMYFFYDFPAGTRIVREMNLLDFCDARIISLYSDRSCIKIGNRFGYIDNDNARAGYEVLMGPRSIMTPEYISQCERKMFETVLE